MNQYIYVYAINMINVLLMVQTESEVEEEGQEVNQRARVTSPSTRSRRSSWRCRRIQRHLFNNPVDVVSLTFLHTWFVLDLAEDVVYHSSVRKLKKTKSCTCVISYNNAVSDSDDDAVNKTVTRCTLVVETLFGDLVLVV